MQTHNSCNNVNGTRPWIRMKNLIKCTYFDIYLKKHLYFLIYGLKLGRFKDELISKKFDFQMNIHKKWLHE